MRRTLRLAPLLLASALLLCAGALQPEGRGDVAPDRVVDIQHLALELAIDVAGRSVEGAAVHTVRALREGVRSIAFHQAGLRIGQVLFDGSPVPFRLGDERVFVTLPEAPPAGSSHELRFEYSARPTSGLHFRLPGHDSPDEYQEVWSQGEGTDNRFWFPTWDDPSDRFTFDGRFSAEDRFSVVSVGTLAGKEPAAGRPGWTTWRYRLDRTLVSYLVAVAVAPYERFSLPGSAVPLEVYAPPGTDEETAARTVGDTAEMIDLFSRVTGVPYPWPVYRQTFVQRFIFSGMENTSATTMHRRLLYPARVEEHRDPSDGIVAHELAHQWYGDLLTCRTWREMWLNEGFATWMTALWRDHALGPEAGAVDVWDRFQGVIGADASGPRVLVRRFFSPDAPGADPYGKGASLLQMLRVMLGDDVFFAGLAAYTRGHQEDLVETDDLRRAMEDVSGWELDWFFDQWAFMGGHPDLVVRHEVLDGHEAEAGDTSAPPEDAAAGPAAAVHPVPAAPRLLRVTITQRQGQPLPLFTLPVDLEIATTQGVRVERVWLDGPEATATFDLLGDLRWVAVDPMGGLLASIEHEQGPDERVAQLQGTTHPYARVAAFRALRQLQGRPSAVERDAVASFLRDASAPLAWRTEAAQALGAWRDDESAAILLDVLRAERRVDAPGSSALRAILAAEVGRGLPQDAKIEELQQLLVRDPVEYVRTAALDALGRLRGEGARGLAITALRASPTDQMILQRGAADLLGKHGRASDLDALASLRKPHVNHELREAAMWASAWIATREPAGTARVLAREPVARDAEAMLFDLNLRGRQTAVAVLAHVGDERSIEALEALRGREDQRSLRDAAAGTIDAIRRRVDREPDPAPAAVDARLQRLEERLDAAEKELREIQERR